MTIDITPEEKLQIVEQHMRSVLYSQYNINLSLIEANALATPNQENLNNLNAQLKDINTQLGLLQKEYDSVNAQILQATSEYFLNLGRIDRIPKLDIIKALSGISEGIDMPHPSSLSEEEVFYLVRHGRWNMKQFTDWLSTREEAAFERGYEQSSVSHEINQR